MVSLLFSLSQIDSMILCVNREGVSVDEEEAIGDYKNDIKLILWMLANVFRLGNYHDKVWN